MAVHIGSRKHRLYMAVMTFFLLLLHAWGDIPVLPNVTPTEFFTRTSDKTVQELVECLPHEFLCRTDRKCVDQVNVCDTKADCSDKSDEDPKFCRSFNCPISHYKCNDGYCIPIGGICDYQANCPDASDELDCNYRKCWHGEWMCKNRQCINEVFLCDGQKDCTDNSDETDCGPEAFIVCDGGKRVHRTLHCDGNPDCDDQADETDCGLCKLGQFACSNGRCIPESHICDSHCDCYGTCDDEAQFCNKFYDGVPGLAVCRRHKTIECNKTKRCIHEEFICDGKDDCLDGGTDEFRCHLNQSLPSTFKCTDGRTLPDFAFCDLQRHCLQAEDELFCRRPPCSSNQFRCHSGQCILKSELCDSVPNCIDGSDEVFCKKFHCPEGTFKCRAAGNCIPSAKHCDLRTDCIDGSDEPYDCPYRLQQCTHSEFRCKNGQCIDKKSVCLIGFDLGCLDGSHLSNCSSFLCDGHTWMKCRNGPCYHASLQCNGLPDCYKGSRTWTDEEGCPFQCSSIKDCICLDVTMECRNAGLLSLPEFVEAKITRFILSGNRLNVTLDNMTFRTYQRLTFLDLSGNGITVLPQTNIFGNLWQLRVLNLQNNRILEIRSNVFAGLASVRVLNLRDNGIRKLKSHSFNGLSTLPQLDLSNQQISSLPAHTFTGLRNLMSLNLSGNPIKSIHPHAFAGLTQLVTLDLSNTTISWDQSDYPAEAFFLLTFLTNFYTSDARYCCSIGSQVDNCHPKVDYFSSCADLMSNILLRSVLWIMGIISLLANSMVIYWRFPDCMRSRVHAFLIINLAFGDLVMGVYLLLIAGADVHYRGSYVYHLYEWKRSSVCSAAGFLSTVSSELSIFTLLIITLDRLFTILVPFHLKIRLTFTSARVSMLIVWFFVLSIALTPFLPISYFEHFYGRSGVCLALHITPEPFPGFEYSLFIFLGVNMSACLLIVLAYAGMYIVALKTHRAADQNPENNAVRNRKESRLARRMVLIISTNLACYLPISILSIMALANVAIPAEMYSWVAVFMLPVNSALNPLLYTMSNRMFRQNLHSSISYRAQHLRESLLASISSSRRRTSTTTVRSMQSTQLANSRAARGRNCSPPDLLHDRKMS